MGGSGSIGTRHGVDIAWIEDGPAAREARARCGFFWLGGFMSDMTGGKATALGALAARSGRSAVRFDYSGHGASGGRFEDGTIGRWLDEAETVFRRVATGPRLVIGSSMGGWLALLLYARLRARDAATAARIRGLVLLAPATDMTQALMLEKFTPDMRERLRAHGRVEIPSDYSETPYVITRELIEEGARHLLLEKGLEVTVPVRILHGEDDRDVPWEHGLRTFRALRGEDVTFTLIGGADHRLSGPRELLLLQETVLALCARADGATMAAEG